MVKQARDMISEGAIGKVRRVVVEYPQGWLSTSMENADQKQAAWRTDPTKAGVAGAMGDIGSHAFHLVEYISGERVSKICADLHAHVEGRKLDDDGTVLLRFSNGARGVLYASQISAGEENNLRVRVYGEKGSVDWSQMEPNTLLVRWLDQPVQIIRTGGPGASVSSQMHTRVPSGHPEGYLEAFANIYRNVALSVQARLNSKTEKEFYHDFPGIGDGVRGMKFIETVVKAGTQDEVKWFEL
jgi:predicted dehydrogenase